MQGLPSKFSLLILVFCIGCSSTRVITVWEPNGSINKTKTRYTKIMVTGVPFGPGDTLRRVFEERMAKKAGELGYEAVPASTEFGEKTFAVMGPEETFIKLCESGIDAVWILSVIDKSDRFTQVSNKKYPSSFYYDRILNYSRISHTPGEKWNGERWILESVLFDLTLLQPVAVMQYPLTGTDGLETGRINAAERILGKMTRHKVLRKQPAPRKAF